jgi:chromosome segregation ATPase
MEASHGSEPRFIRLADAPDAVELDTNDLLARLEAQAEQIGRLEEKAEAYERVARAERDGRRRLADRLKRERTAAEALNARAEQAEAALAPQTEEVERLREALALAELQTQSIWAQFAEAERELTLRSRPLWQRLLRRPPAG